MARGIPTAGELAGSVRQFLQDAVMPGTAGRLSFLARVAGNTMAALEREIALGPAYAANQRARLDALGMRDDRELADALRAGELHDRMDEVFTALRATAVENLRISNPRHLEPRDTATG